MSKRSKKACRALKSVAPRSANSCAPKDIHRILCEEDELINEAMRRGVRDALRRHKLLGQAIVIERDGQIVTIPPQEIPDEDEAG